MWKAFYFEGNNAWGQIRSRDDWKRIVEAYSGDIRFLRTAKECPGRTKNTGQPSFGFCGEYGGLLTLGEWADQNQIDLEVD